MHIGFTGTQVGMTEAQEAGVFAQVAILEPTDVTHGDCVGSDDQFDQIARELGLRRHLRPSTLTAKRAHCIAGEGDIVHDAKPPLERNRDIVDEVEALIAAPKETAETVRSGTWSTVRYARKVGKPVYIVWPDGSVTEERTL